MACLLSGVNDKSDGTVSYEYSAVLPDCRLTYKMACQVSGEFYSHIHFSV